MNQAKTQKGEELIAIGQIVKAVGLKGEVKIYSYAETSNLFEDLDSIYLGKKGKNNPPTASLEDTRDIAIRRVRYSGKTPILTLEGVNDRNDAEALQFTFLYMEGSKLPKLPEGEHYVRDLIGFEVCLEEGKVLGTLKDILTETPQKLYVVSREVAQNEPGTDSAKDFAKKTAKSSASAKGDLLIPGVDEFILDRDIEKRRITVRIPEGLDEI